ncbi:unnamed protein product [Rotaria sp. Silwood1]|nr:unnamed protein product [Rotaria sp. Silwood1]CAF1654260.1 unnamed protein product [Rotaria sp. Silwood1]CAF3946462.1 unnamed protein product [Rotaria sp. Silwood1]CAF5016426.1 unnamed protein product [Rotaria sp. Silwood1]
MVPKSISAIVGLLFIVVIINGGIDDKCLECICQVESKCLPLPCAWDVNSLSCGYYQLKELYWEDCGSPGDSFEDCAANKTCSEECVRTYVDLYAQSCIKHGIPTCEDYARIHNGGPRGCRKKATLPYWQKVSACYSTS